MGAEHRYSNIERKTLGILHGLKKFHHYCFTREVHVITNHKPLVAILKKRHGNAITMHTVYPIKIHQYRVQILYKPRPEIFIADWLSQHNHHKGKDELIQDMEIRVDTILSATDIPECISISQVQQAMVQDEHLQHLKNIIVTGWLSTRDQLHIDIRLYWSYKGDLAVIDGVVMKGRCIIKTQNLQQQVLDQLHLNHMGIEKTKLLMHKLVYWANINTDIENHIKVVSCLEFQQMQPKEKIIDHDIPLRPCKVLGVDIFHFNNKNYLCIVYYHSKFPVIKRMQGLSAESLITKIKVIFAEYGILHRLISDAGSSFVSEKSRSFSSSLNSEQAVSSLYHHQSNGHVEACIKFIKHMIKKYSDSGSDTHMALLQI